MTVSGDYNIGTYSLERLVGRLHGDNDDDEADGAFLILLKYVNYTFMLAFKGIVCFGYFVLVFFLMI